MNITAVILNYNDYKTTIKCLESIADYDLLSYIVVVDNCSTNSSFEMLSRYASNKIHIIKTDKNGGYAYGNNFGVKYALNNFTVDSIIISNPDVSFNEEIIYKMIDTLKLDDKIAIVAPNMINAHGRQEVPAWKLPRWKDDIILSIEVLVKLFGNPLSYKESELSETVNYVDVIPGSFFMITKQAFSDVVFFDEDTFLYCEERILAYKLKEKGYQVILRKDIDFIHEHSVSINNSIKSVVSKYEILCESRKVYHRKYLKTNRLQDIIFKIVSSLGIAEKILISKIKRK